MGGSAKAPLADRHPSALPIALPIPANLVTKRQPERTVRQRTVVETPVIFQPRRMRGVLVKVLRRHRMMLAVDHAAKAREKRLRLIGASTIEAIRLRMVDAVNVPSVMQCIPV
jgi:hypothetical protein